MTDILIVTSRYVDLIRLSELDKRFGRLGRTTVTSTFPQALLAYMHELTPDLVLSLRNDHVRMRLALPDAETLFTAAAQAITNAQPDLTPDEVKSLAAVEAGRETTLALRLMILGVPLEQLLGHPHTSARRALEAELLLARYRRTVTRPSGGAE